MDFLRNRLAYGSLCQPDSRFVRVRTVDATAVGDEIYPPSEHVDGLVDPFRIHRGIEAMDVTPSRLLRGGTLICVAETNTNYVIRSKNLFDGVGDGDLCLSLWKVIGD